MKLEVIITIGMIGMAILVVLTILSLGVQQSQASNFYEIKDAKELKSNSIDNAKHYSIKGSN